MPLYSPWLDFNRFMAAFLYMKGYRLRKKNDNEWTWMKPRGA